MVEHTGPIVRFMLAHTALLPPTSSTARITPSTLPVPITCRPCPETMAGGYSPTLGILLCQNRFMSRKHVEDALAHELVHVWDGRRFSTRGGGEWGSDLRSHACTEVSQSSAVALASNGPILRLIPVPSGARFAQRT